MASEHTQNLAPLQNLCSRLKGLFCGTLPILCIPEPGGAEIWFQHV